VNPLLVIAAVFALYFCAWKIHGYFQDGKQVRWDVMLLGFALVAQFTLTGQRLMGVSTRIVVLCSLFPFAVHRILKSELLKHVVRELRGVWIWCLAFYAWVFFTWLVTQQSVSASAFVNDMLANRIVPLLFLVSFIAFVRTDQELRFVVYTILVTLSASASVAVLQYFNVGAINMLQSLLHPGWYEHVIFELGKDDLPIYVCGLSSYSIPYSYTVMTFSPLCLAYSICVGDSRPMASIAAGVLYVVCCTTIFLCQSRSGFLSVCLTLAFGVALVWKRREEFRVQRLLLLFLFAVVFIFALASAIRGFDVRYLDFSKIARFSDNQRVIIAKAAIDEIKQNLVWGYGHEEFSQAYGGYAHNTFANAGLSFGVPGIAFVIWFYFLLGKHYWMEWTGRIAPRYAWIRLGVILGSLAYIFNGLTHNDSIESGGLYLFILLGVGMANRDHLQRENSTQASVLHDESGLGKGI